MSNDELSKIEEYWKNNGKYLELRKHRLLHGDLDKDNLKIYRGKLEGIIDASDAMPGDPYYDLGCVYLLYSPELNKHFFKSSGLVDFDKVRFFAVYWGCWKVLSSPEKHFKKKIRNFKKRVLEELK